jgi:hypothetical protein
VLFSKAGQSYGLLRLKKEEDNIFIKKFINN